MQTPPTQRRPRFDPDERQLLRRFVRGELTFAQLEGIGADQAAKLAQLGHELFRRGRLHDARTLFEGMCALNPLDPYPQQVLGAIAERERRRGEAEKHYDLCLDLHPGNAWVLARRGELRLLREALAEGISDLEQALSRADPGAAFRGRAEVILDRLRGAARQGAGAASRAGGGVEAVGDDDPTGTLPLRAPRARA